MKHAAYDISWVGIDAGREGLWEEPVWMGVVELVGKHEGEKVYDPTSPIYIDLIKEFPNEKWCSLTPEKKFRPLFRDYPNSWTRTGVISLRDRKFRLTQLGKKLIDGSISRSDILIDLFSKHSETNSASGEIEAPFSIIAHAFLDSPRPLTAKEVFWVIMKNYRPEQQNFEVVLSQTAKYTPSNLASTPYRRLRHMLKLLRAAEAIESYRRGQQIFWGARDKLLLNKIIWNSKRNLTA